MLLEARADRRAPPRRLACDLRRNVQGNEPATLPEGTIASLFASLTALMSMDARRNPLRCPLQPICGDALRA